MPESGVTKHSYLFCQFVNPERGHEGGRCDCFDTPSQRRTTLAKQRLARLQANRSINRASTSNDPESAVASNLAVTIAHIRNFCFYLIKFIFYEHNYRVYVKTRGTVWQFMPLLYAFLLLFICIAVTLSDSFAAQWSLAARYLHEGC